MKRQPTIVVFALFLALLLTPLTTAGALKVPMPTGAPQEYNADQDRGMVAGTEDAFDEATEGTENAEEADAETKTEGNGEESFGEDGEQEAESESEGEENEENEEESSGDWDSSDGEETSASQNRTTSEQETIAQKKERLRRQMHTETVNPDLALEAVIGYGGIVTYTKAIPVEVTIKNEGGDIDGYVALNLYRTNTYYDRVEYPVFVPSGTEKTVRFDVELTMLQNTYTIEYISEEETVAAVNVTPGKTVSPDTCLVGVLSENPNALAYMTVTESNDALMRAEYFQTVPVSAETFPDTLSGMSAFGVLVVDGIDLTRFSDAQKAAFDGWLRAGGIAVVGGGATASAGYPFFEPYTGVSAGALLESEDITPEILRYLGVAEESLGQGVMLNAMDGGEGALCAMEENPLIRMEKADGGIVYLAAFELGARPLTDWKSIGTLWQRVFLASAPDSYALLNSYSYDSWNNDEYYRSSILETLPLKSDPGQIVLLIWILSAFIVLAGVAAYFMLKKMDKRDLLWLVMPAMALAAAFLVYRVGTDGAASTPVGISYTRVTIDQAGRKTVESAAGVASASNESVTVSAGQDIALTPEDVNSFEDRYYDDSTTFLGIPTQARYVRRLGVENSVTLPATTAWTLNSLSATDERTITGDISASVWMEEDGMHGRVKNETPYTLTGCFVMMSAGYCDVPDLAPGAEAEFALLKMTDAEKKALTDSWNSSDYSYVPEGKLISDVVQNGSNFSDSYRVMNSAIRTFTRYADPEKRKEVSASYSEYEKNIFDVRYFMVDATMEKDFSAGNATSFVFYGFNEELGAFTLTMDGKPVTRSAHYAMIAKGINYQPVGPTGIVYYPIGMILAHEAIAEGAAPWAKSAEALSGTYYRVSDSPVFAFQIPDAAKISDLAVTIQSVEVYNSPIMSLYNFTTQKWDDQKKIYLTLSGAQLADYLDEKGQIFVAYRPGPKSGEYDDLSTPAIMVEGRYQK